MSLLIFLLLEPVPYLAPDLHKWRSFGLAKIVHLEYVPSELGFYRSAKLALGYLKEDMLE